MSGQFAIFCIVTDVKNSMSTKGDWKRDSQRDGTDWKNVSLEMFDGTDRLPLAKNDWKKEFGSYYPDRPYRNIKQVS